MADRLPLSGVRVFDLTLWLVGSWASMQLGSLGADVIHIEQPDVVWETLGVRVPPNIRGMPHGFVAWNMNKRQLFLDLKRDEGRAIALELIKTSDVFLTNMRTGVAERLGLGYEALSPINPRLVYVSITGWGETGPRAQQAANDVMMQYVTGFGAQSGNPGDPSEISRHFGYFDTATGDWGAQAALLGLVARKRTGRGQKIELNMLHALTAIQAPRVAEYLIDGRLDPPQGSASLATAPDEAYETKDGFSIGVSVTSEAEWRAFCAAVELPDLLQDERFATNRLRVANREALCVILRERFRRRPLRHWVVRFADAKVPAGYPMRFQDLQYHQQVVENEQIVELQSEVWGPHRVGGPPWRFSRTPARMEPTRVPGADTGQVLAEVEASIHQAQGNDVRRSA